MTPVEPGTVKPGKAARLVWLAVALALVVGLPFLGKPFHIDDPVVLAVSRQILVDPWRPFAGQINWDGISRSLFEQTTNPPLVSYCLAPFLHWFGPSELALHGAMLLFLLMLALSTAALCRRFARGSAWPLLFVMLSPAVVVSSNVMRDVPAAALSAAALALFIAGVDRDRRWLVLAGGLVGGLAMLTKYSAAILAPVAVAYLGTRRRWRYWWGLLPGVGLLALWCLENYLTTGQVHLATLWASEGDPGGAVNRVWPLFPAVGASLLLAPASLAAAVGRRQRWLWAAAPAPVLIMVAAGSRAGGQWMLWAGMGALLLFITLMPLAVRQGGQRQGDELFLAAWAGVVLLFSVFLVMFQAVRHVLPAVVPLALLAARQWQGVGSRRWLVAVLAGSLAVQAGLAFAAGLADYQYADTYRQFARRERAALAGHTTWFVGHWGWQEYAQQAGWRQLGPQANPRPGDLLVVPERVQQDALPEALEERLEWMQTEDFTGRLPLRTMDGYRQAGFYSLGSRQVPYAFTDDPLLESFTIYRVGGRP